MFNRKNIKSHKLHVYEESSWEDDLFIRKSTKGILIYIDYDPVCWSFKHKTVITHRTAKSECLAVDSTVRMMFLFQFLLGNFNENEMEPTMIQEDNTASLVIAIGEGRFLTS